MDRAAFAYPVPALPNDNLIVNPWFRNLSDLSEPGYDGWIRPLTDGVTWGPSQKESNPSPDIVVSGVCGFEAVYCGTAARWAEQFGVLYPDIDVYTYQVVAADPSYRKLRFFAYYVSHLVEVGAVNVYAGQSPDGPWELLWVPLYHTEDKFIIPESGESRDLWQETGFLEWNFEQGFPYYKIELHSRLPESPIPNGIRGVGFKITGIYFSATATDEPGLPPPTPGYSGSAVETGDTTGQVTGVPPASPASATPIPSREAPAETVNETQSNLEVVSSLKAEALSPTEIMLMWDTSQNSNRGLRVERSLDKTAGWQSLAQVGRDVVEFKDTGLLPDTFYYYRLRITQNEVSNVATVKTLPQPDLPLAVPAALQAQSDEPQQVVLSWRDLSDNEAGFQIERSLDKLNFILVATLGQDETTYTDTDLAPATFYYRLRSYRDDTFSDYSEVVSVMVMNGLPATSGSTSSAHESDQAATPASTGQAGEESPSGQPGSLILPMVFVALIVGAGLGAVLTRRGARNNLPN